MKHVFIINPHAGKQDQTSRILAMAEHLRTAHELDCSCMLTDRPGGATDMARTLAESGQSLRIYACGGDGTIFEVVNGLAGFDNAAMTCIPFGTGNDFLKNFGDDQSRFLDPEQLWDSPAFPLDLIDCNGRYCITIACNGLDAQVAEDVHRYSRNRLLNGRGSYVASAVANVLLKSIGHHWTVFLDDERIEDEFALVSMCNGRHYGGGSMPVPEARMNDGLLHTVLIKKVSRTTFARMFGPYSAGEYQSISPSLLRVSTAKVVRIRSHGTEIVTCLDGECSRSQEVVMRLADKQVNFFGPQGCDCNRTAR